MVIEKAKRLVEHKRDVVILLDSITRLARAYNTIVPPSGKVLSGGVDSKRVATSEAVFFWRGRISRKVGSLTIIATALVDTGSRMDDVIFEEFKGTGTWKSSWSGSWWINECFPPLTSSAPGPVKKSCSFQGRSGANLGAAKGAEPLSPVEAMELLIDKLSKTRSNGEFLANMSSL